MATIEIIRHKVSGFASSGGTMPIADGNVIYQKIVTLTATSQKLSDVDAQLVAESNEVWTVIVAGGPARLSFGLVASAVAASSVVGWPLTDGTMKPFNVPKGYTATIING